jgi:hypothetical protein
MSSPGRSTLPVRSGLTLLAYDEQSFLIGSNREAITGYSGTSRDAQTHFF